MSKHETAPGEVCVPATRGSILQWVLGVEPQIFDLWNCSERFCFDLYEITQTSRMFLTAEGGLSNVRDLTRPISEKKTKVKN